MAGVGLRPVHHSLVLGERPKVAWFEVHAENFMTRGACGRTSNRLPNIIRSRFTP